MTKLIIGNIVGERNGILDLKEDMIKTLKNISTVSEDFRRIDWKLMKIALIV